MKKDKYYYLYKYAIYTYYHCFDDDYDINVIPEFDNILQEIASKRNYDEFIKEIEADGY